VRENPGRRAALLDAAIEVLARDGARGLTFRAVDAQAGVPVGTTSNYVSSRDALLTQVGHRYYERLEPDPAVLAATRSGAGGRGQVEARVREVVGRVTTFRTGFLALLELRLEATRRPELRRLLTERVRVDLHRNVAAHLEAGLPGDEATVTALYLAVNWLILERLTLPGVIPPESVDARIAELVRAVVPAT
jgi:DNA-binding transcriptional regulator YbjK